MRKRLFYLTVLLSLFAVTAGIDAGTITFTSTSTLTIAATISHEDIVQFFDSSLDNVTVYIDPTASPTAGMHLKEAGLDGYYLDYGKVTVRAATKNYSVFDWVETGDELHLANPTFLNAYYSFAQATGISNMKMVSGYANVNSPSGLSFKEAGTLDIAGINGMFSIMAENDTAEASGYTAEGDEEFALDDLYGSDNQYSFTYLNYTSWNSVEPQYSDYAKDLREADDGTAFLPDDVNEDDKQSWHYVVTGFNDLQDAVLDVLEANVAANLTAAGYGPYTQEDITVVSYDHINSTANCYISANYYNNVREEIDEVLAGETAGVYQISVFGFITFSFKGTVPVKALTDATSADLLGGLSGTLMNLGQMVVSLPMNVIEGVAKLPGDTIDLVSNTVTGGVSFVQGAVNGILGAPESFMKTVGGVAGEFVTKVGPTVTNLVDTGAGLVSKGFNGIMGGISSIISQFAPLIIIGVVILGLLAVGYIYMNKRSTGIIP